MERGSVIFTADFMDNFSTTFACGFLCYHSGEQSS